MLTGTMPSSLYLSEAVDVPKIILTVAFGKLHSNNPIEEKHAITMFYLSNNMLIWKNGKIKDISVQSS
jgi:hypothetical protein